MSQLEVILDTSLINNEINDQEPDPEGYGSPKLSISNNNGNEGINGTVKMKGLCAHRRVS